MAHYDAEVAIVGSGAWGTSALWRLSERGVRAIAFDAQTVPNVYGSSHGHTRLFRVACHEHVDLTPVARRAKELWLELSADQGTDLLHETGVLSIGPEDGRAIRNVRKAVAYAGVDVTQFTIDEVRERYPQHANLGNHYIGILDHEAGFVRAEESITAAAAAATSRGSQIFEQTAVTDIVDDGGGVIVRTAARDFRVGQVILSSGAWMTKMQDVVPLTAVRAPMLWWEAKEAPEEFGIDRFPAFIRHYDDDHTLWGHGSTADAPVKLGPSFDQHSRMLIDPDQVLRGVRPGVDWATVAGVLPWAIPGLKNAPALAAPCLVTESPDMQFVIGRHPDRPRVVLAGGCSGHGFKHASAVGELLAQLVTGEDTFSDIGFMSPDRFR